MTVVLPLLICGHHRSGTTLLASLLDGHPDVLLFPYETGVLPMAMAGTLGPSADAAIEIALTHAQASTADPLPFDRDALTSVARDRIANVDAAARTATSVLEAIVFGFGTARRRQGHRYWAEKSPGNEAALVAVLDDQPQARAIYIVRDPRDVLVSYREWNRVGAGHETPSEQVAKSWLGSALAWHAFLLRGGRGLTIRYESLIADPSDATRCVCEFLGIERTPSLTEPSRDGQAWPGNRADFVPMVGVERRRTGRWTSALTAADVSVIEQRCGPMMRRHGYRGSLSRPSRLTAATGWPMIRLRLAASVPSVSARVLASRRRRSTGYRLPE